MSLVLVNSSSCISSEFLNSSLIIEDKLEVVVTVVASVLLKLTSQSIVYRPSSEVIWIHNRGKQYKESFRNRPIPAFVTEVFSSKKSIESARKFTESVSDSMSFL